MWSNPPRDNLLQHILITNPIIVFDPVDTLDLQKSESIVVLLTEKKTFSNYSTQTPTSLNLADRWLRGFFFYPLNGFVCCQPFQPASCTFPTTLWLFTQFLQWNHDMHLKITFGSPHLHPGSSMPTAGITIHYVSAGKGCKGPGRSSHHISLSGPVTCTDKLPGSYFYFFLLHFLQ